MSDLHGLWMFFVVVVGVLVLPGMDMAFVIASSVVSGVRAGAVAIAGLVFGGFIHVAVVGTGLAGLLRTFPSLLPAMLIAGSLYLVWIGWQILQKSTTALPDVTQSRRTLRLTFLRAAGTCLLNPKAYLFMLAIFPQFVSRGPGMVNRIIALALITAMSQVLVYGSVAFMAGTVQRRLRANASGSLWMTRAIGGALMSTAFLMLVRALQMVMAQG